MKTPRPRWLKRKAYVHFFNPPRLLDTQIIERVMDPAWVEQRSFLPLLHFSIIEHRYRRPFDSFSNKRSSQRTYKAKQRQIFYADHMDAHVLAYYAHLLDEKLQKQHYDDSRLNKEVIAYRRIPRTSGRGCKCNIDFAKEVFDFIRADKRDALTVLCLDITDFFPSLKHRTLKREWYRLLDRTDLPDDHYAIFKSVTRYRYVEISDVLQQIPRPGLEYYRLLRQKRKGSKQRITSLCENRTEFIQHIVKAGLVRAPLEKGGRPSSKGIPQGTPISATLSNLYMLSFDQRMSELVHRVGGMYRRYSDDILIVCPPASAERLAENARAAIRDLDLIIKPEKTQVVQFVRNADGWSIHSFYDGSAFRPGKELSYLGFDFNGKRTIIRNSSISKFYRKLKLQIRRAAGYASMVKALQPKGLYQNAEPKIYRRSIYRSRTNFGAKSKRFKDKDGRQIQGWGNYLTYVKRAARIMNEPAIERQVRNHQRMVDRMIRKFELRYGLKRR